YGELFERIGDRPAVPPEVSVNPAHLIRFAQAAQAFSDPHTPMRLVGTGNPVQPIATRGVAHDVGELTAMLMPIRLRCPRRVTREVCPGREPGAGRNHMRHVAFTGHPLAGARRWPHNRWDVATFANARAAVANGD